MPSNDISGAQWDPSQPVTGSLTVLSNAGHWRKFQNINSLLPGHPSAFWDWRITCISQIMKEGKEWQPLVLGPCWRQQNLQCKSRKKLFREPFPVFQQPFQNHSMDEKASHPLPIPSWAKDLRVAAHLNLGKINYGIFLWSNSTQNNLFDEFLMTSTFWWQSHIWKWLPITILFLAK